MPDQTLSDQTLSDQTLSDKTLSGRTTAAPGRDRSRVVEALVLAGRGVRLSRREIDALVMALAMPVMIMLLFVYLFGGAIHTGTAYVSYVVPGVMLLCVGFGAATTAVSVCRDLAGGMADRLRSLDVSAAAMINGQVVASLARNAVATVLVTVVAVAIGFRPRADVLHWLAAAGVLAAVVLTLSWISAAFGVLARAPEAASGFTFFLSFLTYPTSAFVPIATMPHWLQGFARNQPLTHAIEAVRALLLDRPVGSHAVLALTWSAGLTAVSVLVATLLYRRRTV